MLYRICPNCGAALDPGETCDCTKEKQQSRLQTSNIEKLVHTLNNKQLDTLYQVAKALCEEQRRYQKYT